MKQISCFHVDERCIVQNIRFLFAVLVTVGVLLTGCQTSSSPTPPAVDLSGTWTGTTTFQDGVVDNVRFQLNQSESSVSGVFEIRDGLVYLTLGTGEGSIRGDRVSLRLTATLGSGGRGTFSGTASEDRFTGSGTLTNDSGETGTLSFVVTRE